MKNLEALPSGAYRYRKMIDGRNVRITFDHKPTEKEVTLAVTKYISEMGERVPKNSFGKCCENYIEIKRQVLSPSTIRSYYTIVRALSNEIKNTDINNITQITVQDEISQYSKSHSAKSTNNLHGFISAVLKMYRPNLQLSTTLPQKVKYEPYTPSESDIKGILSLSENTKYHIPIQLGILGLRRSEICALDMSDISGNQLTISKAVVKDDKGKWITKEITKTTEGKRTIYLPDSLVTEINKNGMYNGNPDALLKNIHAFQEKLGIPKFRFHDLRAFYASYAHSKGVPDAVIMANGGWKSDYVMKRIYRRALEDDKKKYSDAMSNFF